RLPARARGQRRRARALPRIVAPGSRRLRRRTPSGRRGGLPDPRHLLPLRDRGGGRRGAPMTERLIARRELVERYREFVAHDPSYAPQLAAVLQDLANDAQGVGELEEALAASAEAIAILRRSGDGVDVIAPLAGDL